MKLKIILLFMLISVVIGCGTLENPTTMNDQVDAPILTSDMDSDDFAEFKSTIHEIVFHYPRNWAISESDLSIYFASSEDRLPWGTKYLRSPREPYYYVNIMSPYLTSGDRRLGLARSSLEIAQTIADNFAIPELNGELIGPVSAVNVNGYDGAKFLVEVNGTHHYEVVLRITTDKVVVVAADGPENKSEEMQNVVNAVALTVNPLED